MRKALGYLCLALPFVAVLFSIADQVLDLQLPTFVGFAVLTLACFVAGVSLIED